MELFNVGIPELLFVLVIMLIVMGPQDMAKNSRRLARWIRHITQSDTWRMVRDTTNELRDLPNQLIREAGVEEWEQSLKNQPGNGVPAQVPAPPDSASSAAAEQTILPPEPSPEHVLEPPDEITVEPDPRGD